MKKIFQIHIYHLQLLLHRAFDEVEDFVNLQDQYHDHDAENTASCHIQAQYSCTSILDPEMDPDWALV